MLKPEISVAIPENLNNKLNKFLIREDSQEDLIFALWNPSWGRNRLSALIYLIIFPKIGDRQIHGNVSFNTEYFDRVSSLALKYNCGIAFLHSHPSPGWQGMSNDDILAEQRIASSVDALTELPLLGMTIGSDGTWSARMWEQIRGRQYQGRWCKSVRVAGTSFKADFNDSIVPKPEYKELFKRTITVWGVSNHANLSRLKIGIVGLGSVGSIVAETLARMGMKYFSLIDFDEIQPHNLDRLLGATELDIRQLKVNTIKKQMLKSSTANDLQINAIPYSIAEKTGYEAALDCDILFSCVDRPRPRHILNHFAYAHLIPVIDGGINVRFDKTGAFSGVDWQLQTIGPNRPCLSCLGVYNKEDVNLDENGLLDDPSYLQGLPKNHQFKNNENVFPFSANLASLETMQFIALVTGVGGVNNFGIQRYRYKPGNIEVDIEKSCGNNCHFSNNIAVGDKYFSLEGSDINAETARNRQKAN